jgi:hypothetical protein
VSSFPFTKTYAANLLPSNTGLTPAFSLFKRTDTGASLSAPSVSELGQGIYTFQWTWQTPTDPPIAFVLNGNAPGAINPAFAMEGTLSPADVPSIATGLPATQRVAFHYLPGQTGLAPTFSLCKRLDTGANVTAPPIYELDGAGNGDGWYYFDWTFQTPSDPDVAFLINGAAPSAISPPFATYGVISLTELGAQYLLPPTPIPAAAPNPLANIAPSAIDFGTDISCIGDLDPNFNLVSGVACLAQDLAHRLQTPRGGLPYDAGYGFDTRALLNESTSSTSLAAWRHSIEAQCLQDERVDSCSATLVFAGQNNSLAITLDVDTSEANSFVLVLGVNSLTVSILSITPANQ